MGRLAEIAARMQEIRSALSGTDQVDVAALTAEVEALTAEKGTIEARNALMNKIPSGVPIVNPEQRANDDVADKFASMEYRQAFMQFAKTGKAVPAGFEARSDAFTAVTDAAAVVPTTILDELIKQMKTYGHIFARVRKLGIKGGVDVPILSLKPTATWIGETPTSDRQKVQANTKVQFSYYGLECKVATSLLADTVTLASFESTIITLIVEAMTKAIDLAIIKGSGTGQPLGITLDPRVPAGNIITLSSADFASWEGWKKKFWSKIPLSYRAGGSFITAAGTFEGYIDGMTDANGQPVGRVNQGITDGPQERFNGREVILVEDDVITPYEAAATNDIVAVFCKLGDYAINSNLQLAMYRWLDHDINQYVDKALLIADGKILDPNGVIIVKKGA